MNNCYLYRHIRLDKNEPFYIGIGSYGNSKDLYKRAYCSKRRNRIWKLIASKTEYKVEILFDGLTRDEICKKEIEFIQLYKRLKDKGTLANLTLGGEGTSGYTFKNNLIGKKNKSISAFKRTEEIIKNKAKSFVIITPDDVILKITNLDKFCRDNNILSSNMIKVATKRIKHCSRWRCYYESEDVSNYFYFPKYSITFNNEYVITNNLNLFIKENNLDRANVNKLLKGKAKTIKGFKIEQFNT